MTGAEAAHLAPQGFRRTGEGPLWVLFLPVQSAFALLSPRRGLAPHFTHELNGGASIGDTFTPQLLHFAKTMVEKRRPSIILRHTTTSKARPASANGWQIGVGLSTITRF
jgi:hypothetical protein